MNLTRVGPMMRSNPIEEDGLAKAFDTDEHRIRDFARGYSCRENIVPFAFPSILDPPLLIFQCSVIYHHEIGAIDIFPSETFFLKLMVYLRILRSKSCPMDTFEVKSCGILAHSSP